MKNNLTIDHWNFIRATAEMPLIQRGAYLSLLFGCLKTGFIRNETDVIFRLAGAFEQEEKDATEEVLASLFTLTAKGWVPMKGVK